MSMDVEYITYHKGNALLDWLELAAAIEQGHQMSKAEVKDTFIYRKEDTLLSRSAWIDGLGIAVKSATIFPQNSLLLSIFAFGSNLTCRIRLRGSQGLNIDFKIWCI